VKFRLDPFSPTGISLENTTVYTGGGSSSGGTDVTVTGEDYLSLAAQQITANPIDLDNLSATGTPNSSTFLRGDNTWATPAGSGDVSKVGTPVNNQVGVWTGDGTIEGDADLTFDTATNTLTTVNIAPSGTVDGRDIATDGTKLDGIESGADVTDATNVAAAGATMDADTSLAGNGYFLDEDNMASNSATKVPSQQSVKAYVDAVNVGTVDTVVAGNNIDVDATDPANPIVSVETLTLADISDVTASVTEVNYTDGVTSAIQTQLDNKQPLDSDLTTIAGLTPTTDNFMVAASSAWASRTPAQAKTSLALVKGDVGLGNVDNTSDATKDAAATTLTNKTLTAPKFANGGFIADANGNEEIIFTTTASAVNELTIANAATGNIPTITASGGDTDVSINLISKGAGQVYANSGLILTAANSVTVSNKTLTAPKIVNGGFVADANGNELIIFNTTASAVNEYTITNAANNTNPTIAVTGGSTNIDAVFTPKGTGSFVTTYRYLSNATASSSTGSFVQHGWGFIAGNSANTNTKAVTFPTTFGSVTNVVIGSLGYLSGSDPTTIGGFNAGDSGDVVNREAYSITTSGFTAQLNAENGRTLASSTIRYGFSWIAYGTL
jgi:hypothetical protein